MTEYIEREAISEEIRKYYYKNPPNSSYGEGFDRGLDRAQRAILDAPTADVAPVRHGRWEKAQDMRRMDGNIYDYRCSLCDSLAEKGVYNNYDRLTNYCPSCGAKMDLEDSQCDT